MPSRNAPRSARTPAARTPGRGAPPPPPVTLPTRMVAEALGTFLLVLAGIGTALFASSVPGTEEPVGVGHLGIALAFGFAVVAGATAVGHLSGAHFNPAVTVGLAVAGRLDRRAVPAYVGAQLVGALVATSLLAAIAAGGPAGTFDRLHAAGFAANGFGDRSPGGFGLLAVAVTELVLTGVLVLVVLGATDRRAPSGAAPLAIGLTLALIHLISIPISNTSVNPARSIATAVWGGGDAIGQVWLFVLAPVAGAALAGLLHRRLLDGGGAGA